MGSASERPDRGARLVRAAAAALLGALLVLSAPGLARAQATADTRYIVLYDRSVPSVTRETNGLEQAEGFQTERRYAHAVKGFVARLSDEPSRPIHRSRR